MLGRLGLRFHNRAEEIAFCTSVGLGALAYGVLAVGLLGGLNWLGFGPVIASLTACAVVGARRSEPKRTEKARELGRFEVAVLALAGATFLLLLGGNMAPPGANDWDSLAYHLAAPKIYLADGRIHPIPFMHHSNFPFTMEMLYTLGLFLNGPSLAKLNHLLTLALSLSVLWGAARRFWGERAGAMAVACYLSAPIVMLEATTAYIDLAFALYYLLAAVAFLVWWTEEKRGWLVLSGVCCGLCLGTKMTGVMAFASLAALLAYRAIIRRQTWWTLAWFLVPAVLVGCPWYVKSQIWTGSPTYPFFYGLFGGRGWDAAMAAAYRAEQLKFGVGRGIAQLLWLPIDLAFRHEAFIDQGYAHVLSSPGVLWLCLLPPLLLLRRHDRAFKLIMVLIGLGILGWFYSMQQVRYFTPFLALMALATGYAAHREGEEGIFRWPAKAVVVVVLCLGVLISWLLTLPCWKVVLGFETKQEYLEGSFHSYRAFEYINHSTPPDAKVVTFGEPRGFYCDRPYFWGEPNHSKIIDRQRGSNALGLVSELQRLGVTHVLLPIVWLANNDSDLQELNLPQFREALREAIRLGLLRTVFDDGKAMVLQVERTSETH